jgi:1-phosphofructokinase
VLAELGCRNTALGFVAGETGAWLERGLAAQGITTDFIHLEQGMTRINVKIKAGQETELNGAGPDIPESAMEQLEAQLDQLAEGDILILAGSIPSSLPQTTYERLLARLEGHGSAKSAPGVRLRRAPRSSGPLAGETVATWP